jgi:hypothetical protein
MKNKIIINWMILNKKLTIKKQNKSFIFIEYL